MTKRDQQYRDYVAEHAKPPVSHTPGPWEVYGASVHPYPGIEADGESVVLWGTHDEWSGVRGQTAERRLANAALIAAAPDMLACLSRIVNTPADTPRLYDEIESAIPVILKAKGLLR